MFWFRKLFSINTLILIAAFCWLAFGIRQVFEIFANFNELIPHKGQIASKQIYTENPGEKDSLKFIKLRFADGKEYVVSRYVERLDNLLSVGDSAELFTKKITSAFGNQITNGEERTWHTMDDRDVFHLVSNRYDTPLVDFGENKSNLIKTSWLFPFFSSCFFGWYFYRWSGR